jgi:hypothetical protein
MKLRIALSNSAFKEGKSGSTFHRGCYRFSILGRIPEKTTPYEIAERRDGGSLRREAHEGAEFCFLARIRGSNRGE